jgi:hypothetical protein
MLTRPLLIRADFDGFPIHGRCFITGMVLPAGFT